MKFSVVVICLFFHLVYARRHTLKLKNDARQSVICSKFGFLKNGYLSVSIDKFQYKPSTLPRTSNSFGFTLDKASTSGIASYLETKLGSCILNNHKAIKKSSLSVVYFKFNFDEMRIDIERSGEDLESLRILNSDETAFLKQMRQVPCSKRQTAGLSDSARMDLDTPDQMNKSTISPVTLSGVTPNAKLDVNSSIPLIYNEKEDYFSAKFVVAISKSEEQGFYGLFFHSCRNKLAKVNITLSIVEKNSLSYLAAGEQPLPYVYFAFCVFYFILGCSWLYLLRTTHDVVYKMHYMMLVLIVVKSTALLFHGVNFYVLGKHGIHEEGWAVMYYITHLMKGAILFITIVLIGTGWTFIKHMLSKREKRIFLIIVPLQILANVAAIIIEESEEGNSGYTTWKDIFILVDLLCCGAILFPVVWSIRHLQDASQTDGKVATNLNRLRLFRQFYILIVCYIYFTRIIVYLLNITVPFQWTWLVELFREGSTAVFFVLTGVKFRPAGDNPYMQLASEEDQDDEEMELDTVHTQSGAVDSVVKIRRAGSDGESLGQTRSRKSSESGVSGGVQTRTVLTDRDTRESSHVFD